MSFGAAFARDLLSRYDEKREEKADSSPEKAVIGMTDLGLDKFINLV